MKICMHMGKSKWKNKLCYNYRNNYYSKCKAFILLFTFIADNLPSCCNGLQSSKFSISCTNSSLSFEKAPVVRAWSSNISFIMAVTRPPKTKRGKTSRKCHQIQKKMFKKFKQRIRKMWTMLHTNIVMKKYLEPPRCHYIHN